MLRALPRANAPDPSRSYICVSAIARIPIGFAIESRFDRTALIGRCYRDDGLRRVRPEMEDAMKLFEFAPTRSIRVRWTLQELGVEFESVPVNMIAGEHRSPEYLKINPAGKLPVLVDGDLA